MGLIRAVKVSAMGPRRNASVVRRGMRVSTRLVTVHADRETIKQYFCSMEAFEAYTELFIPGAFFGWGFEITVPLFRFLFGGELGCHCYGKKHWVCVDVSETERANVIVLYKRNLLIKGVFVSYLAFLDSTDTTMSVTCSRPYLRACENSPSGRSSQRTSQTGKEIKKYEDDYLYRDHLVRKVSAQSWTRSRHVPALLGW